MDEFTLFPLKVNSITYLRNEMVSFYICVHYNAPQVAQDSPTPVFEPEAPPGYDALMETELRELPSYLEAVCHREPVSSV